MPKPLANDNEPFAVNEDSVTSAKQIIGNIDPVLDHFAQRRSSFLPDGPALSENTAEFSDVEETLSEALDDLGTYSWWGHFPEIQTSEGPVTVSRRYLLNDRYGSDNIVPPLSPSDLMPDAARKWVQNGPGRTLSNPVDGIKTFRSNLLGFLSHRLAGLGWWDKAADDVKAEPGIVTAGFNAKGAPTASISLAGSFNVTVSCINTNYRILVTPAYFINWVYFGAPSTPVSKPLMPGRYIFGTDSPTGSITSDSAVFSIPTDFSPVLTRF